MVPIEANNTVERFARESNQNVFVMMRYGGDEDDRSIEETIKTTLRRFNFQGILARDHMFHAQCSTRNSGTIEFCMQHSRYGIVVFEENPPAGV